MQIEEMTAPTRYDTNTLASYEAAISIPSYISEAEMRARKAVLMQSYIDESGEEAYGIGTFNMPAINSTRPRNALPFIAYDLGDPAQQQSIVHVPPYWSARGTKTERPAQARTSGPAVHFQGTAQTNPSYEQLQAAAFPLDKREPYGMLEHDFEG